MRPGHVLIAALSFSLTQHAKADIFYLKDQWSGSDFLEGWNWFTEDDPTNGHVNYVSQDEAKSKHLAYGMFLFSSSFSVQVIRPNFSGGRQIHYAYRRLVHREHIRAWARQRAYLFGEYV